MGEHQIDARIDAERLRAFTRLLLEDVRALERMVDEGLIEADVRRIGAEQEMFLVDEGCRPMPAALDVLKELADDPAYTVELGLFNLEANLTPYVLGGDCLSAMERELDARLAKARAAAARVGVNLCLTGILPTIEKDDLTLENMTPSPRFHELNRVMCELRGGEFNTLIKGVDELQLAHDNVMLEACNTSFQVHFQVGASEFAKLYNLAQAVTAPVLAAGVNSPVLLGHRLWKETRVALFQQSLDVRSKTQLDRGKRQRVSFGERWIKDSVLEIFREDVARFRVLIASDAGESPLAMLDRGEIPPLRALCLHNGTVYRWNRPCYGVKDGTAHLRIENRVLPAGPTVLDEVANAAFFFGLMLALSEEYGDITRVMNFDDAKDNFVAAARYGLKARFTWVRGRSFAADELILDHLLPLARRGLRERGIPSRDVDRYLGVIEGRVRSGVTGAKWSLASLANMEGQGTVNARMRALTKTMVERQFSGEPVHTWPLAKFGDGDGWKHSYRTVGQVMTRDVFTVHPEDLVDLAACLMEWEHIRHVPVEDQDGRLVGLVSHRSLLRMVGDGLGQGHASSPTQGKTSGKVAPSTGKAVAVREIMKPAPVHVSPDTPILDAIELMRHERVSCLPVTKDGKLVGIVTERDFIQVAGKLLEKELRQA